MVTGESGRCPLTPRPILTSQPHRNHSLFFLTHHSFQVLSSAHCLFPFPHLARPPRPPAVAASEPPQALPLCLKQEMSPEVTSTSPSPNMVASNLAFVELQALQKPVSVSSSSSSCCGNSNHFPNTFNSFSHHAPVYGQFSSQPIMSGNAGIQFIHFHTHVCVFHKKLWMMLINLFNLNKVLF